MRVTTSPPHNWIVVKRFVHNGLRLENFAIMQPTNRGDAAYGF